MNPEHQKHLKHPKGAAAGISPRTNWGLVDAVGRGAAANGLPDLDRRSEIHVLMALAKSAKPDGTIDFIDSDEIAKLTGLQWTTVQLAIHRLRSLGYVDDSAEPYRIRHAPDPDNQNRLVVQPRQQTPQE